MLGMMQIMIWLLCVYLVFKGVEIFQIAWMSPRESRSGGIALGALMVVVAVIAAISFVVLEEQMAAQVTESQRNIPNFNFNR